MAKVNAAPSASTFPSMPSGVSPSRKHSTTPARITATPATSSFEGRFLRTTASKRITTTGMAYCSTMALAAEVYLLASINSTEVAMTPNAPSQLPKVLAGRKSRRARPRKTAATRARAPAMVSAFQGMRRVSRPLKLQQTQASSMQPVDRRFICKQDPFGQR